MIEANKEQTFELTTKRGMGWLPDLPDFRDFTVENEQVAPTVTKAKSPTARLGVGTGPAAAAAAPVVALAPTTDLRAWFSPIEDQRQLGSCTANAGVGLIEYFERRAFGRHIDASRLFLYKVTRNLLNFTGVPGLT